MESGTIPDSKISASSEWNSNHGPTNARLNFQAGNGKTGAWSAKTNDVNQWLKVDFDRPLRVTHIQTQGRQDCCNQWVTSYAVSYSHDNIHWQSYTHNGQQKVTAFGDSVIYIFTSKNAPHHVTFSTEKPTSPKMQVFCLLLLSDLPGQHRQKLRRYRDVAVPHFRSVHQNSPQELGWPYFHESGVPWLWAR